MLLQHAIARIKTAEMRRAWFTLIFDGSEPTWGAASAAATAATAARAGPRTAELPRRKLLAANAARRADSPEACVCRSARGACTEERTHGAFNM